jgi:hypothetical protein
MKLAVNLSVIWLCVLASAATAATSTLSVGQRVTLQAWLAKNPNYQLATAKDCNCDDDIRQMRKEGPWGQPIPDFEPFLRVGDFRQNGQSDVAAVVIDRAKNATDRLLVVFDGPNWSAQSRPAYVGKISASPGIAIFQTHDNGRLIVGRFESEGCVYQPRQRSYVSDCR